MAYVKSRRIVIDKTRIGGSTQTSFPMLFSGTYYWLANTAQGGSVTSQYGFDIGFFADKELTKKLFWEVETYNPRTGLINAWVQIPIMSSTVDTVIYLGYGDSTITTFQSNAARVWDSNYIGVWHLGDGSGLNPRDSTANANHGTITAATAQAGQIDGAGAFSGSSQYITITDAVPLRITGDLTVSCWMNPTDYANYNAVISKTDGGGAAAPFDTYLVITTGAFRLWRQGGTVDATTSAPTGTWSYQAGTATGANSALFMGKLDGTFFTNGSGNIGTGPADQSTNVLIGSRNGLFTMMKGGLDEVRLSNVARSQAWLNAEFNTSVAPSTFYTIGADN